MTFLPTAVTGAKPIIKVIYAVFLFCICSLVLTLYMNHKCLDLLNSEKSAMTMSRHRHSPLEASSWPQQAAAVSYPPFQPFQAPNITSAREQKTWFQVTISSEHDQAMIPHIISHYTSLRIPTHRFLVVLHHKDSQNSPAYQQAHYLLTHQTNISHILPWIGVYSSAAMFRHRQQLRRLAAVHPDDWIVHADSDQLHEFPFHDAPSFLRMVHELRYDAVYGYYVDRVSADGTLTNITATPPLAQQFPLACHVSTQVVQLNNRVAAKNRPRKIMAFLGRYSENRGGGKLEHEQEGCVFPARLRTHHYKWVWPVIQKMELRVVVEKGLSWHYQATNVLEHLRQHGGKIGVGEAYLRCERESEQRMFPVSPNPVDVCAKHKYREDDLTRLRPDGPL